MLTLFEKLLKLKNQNPKDLAVRQKYGMLAGILGISFNVLLFIGKLISGLLSQSISITADAFNNLTDASSSIITMIGFKMSNQKPDKDHPFGHGRIEYISGVIVSFLIIIVGVELVKSSFNKVFHPEELFLNNTILFILLASIFIKIYMAYYTFKISKHINSSTMKATAIDSRNDALTTTVVLITSVISYKYQLNLDGYVGIIVGVFIVLSGISAAKDTINPLLGEPPTTEFICDIKETVLSHNEILGIHDIMVHNYGPGRIILSLHAEIPYNCDIIKIHDTIDNIEKELNSKFNCLTTIHMDPLQTDDPITNKLQNYTIQLLHENYPELSLHDFRTVIGPTHTNVLFDLVIPYSYKVADEDIKEFIENKFKQLDANYYVIIDIDKDFLCE